MTDDGQLLHQYIKEKSDTAFAELVRRHLGLVYHAALRQLGGDTHGAQDVTQEVFIRLARYAPVVRYHPTLAGWLYQTTHFKAREEIRARRRRQVREQKAQLMEAQEAAAAPAVTWERLRPVLDEIIMDLGKTDREAIILRYFKARSYSAIGAELGLTEDTAQKRVERALGKLRLVLARKEQAASASALALLLTEQAGFAAPTGLEFSVTSAALASLAHVAPSSLYFLQLVGSTKAALSTAGALALAAALGVSSAGLMLYEARNAHETQAALTQASQAYGGDWARVRSLTEASRNAGQENAELERQIAGLGGARATPVDPQAEAAAEQAELARNVEHGTQFLRAFPQAWDPIRTMERNDLRESLGPFLKLAGISADQYQALEELAVQFRATHLAVGDKGGIGPSVLLPPDDALRPILGEEALRLFQEYKRSLPARGSLLALQLEAGLQGAPLSADKVNQLTQILANASSAYRNGHEFTMATLDWPAATAEIQAVVSPQQWSVIRSGLLNIQLGQMARRIAPIQN